MVDNLICDCLSKNVPGLHNYKYLEIRTNLKYSIVYILRRQRDAYMPFSTNP